MSKIIWHTTNMTSNTAPSPFVASASSQQSSTYYAWKAFDGKVSPTLTESSWSATSTLNSGWIQIFYGTPKIVDRISITIYGYSNSPKNFKVLGSVDGTNWEELLNIVNHTAWNQVENNDTRIFELNKKANHSYYRLDVSATNATGTTNLQPIITEIKYGFLEYEQKHLLQSNNKIYSLDSIGNGWFETKMTSNTTPAPFIVNASSTQGSYDAWKAFNGTTSSYTDGWATASGITTGWVQINFGLPKLFSKIRITSKATANIGGVTSAPPKDFNILGSNDGINFKVLAEIKNQTNWSATETREFTLDNFKLYTIYRIEILSNSGTSYTALGNVIFFEKYSKLFESSSENITKNILNYGRDNLDDLDNLIPIKNYILQDEVSENSEGLWITKLDRKPLSISFN